MADNITYDGLLEIVNSGLALNRDSAKFIAKAMSCDLSDDELLLFWNHIQEYVHSVDEKTKDYSRFNQRLNNQWLKLLIANLSLETVEFLADTPNPLDMSNYHSFELGDMVQPMVVERSSKSFFYDFTDAKLLLWTPKIKDYRFYSFALEEKKKEVPPRTNKWNLYRGIWMQNINVDCPYFIDLEKENKYGHKGGSVFNLSANNKEPYAKLRSAMSWSVDEFQNWRRDHLSDLCSKWIDESAVNLKKAPQHEDENDIFEDGDNFFVEKSDGTLLTLGDFHKFKKKVTPLEMYRHPIGIVTDKVFVPHSIDCKISDCWFYKVLWAGQNDNCVSAWYAEITNHIEPLNKNLDIYNINI